MRKRVVARRYAKALMEIGYREKRIGEIYNELEDIQSMLEKYPKFKKAVFLPIYPLENRKKILNKVLKKAGFSVSIIRFFDILIEKDRIGLLQPILSIYQELADRAQNRVRGTLYTPKTLEKGDFEKIKEALSRYMGKEIILKKEKDPSLIGGIRARIGGIIIDGSIRGNLDRFREKLLMA